MKQKILGLDTVMQDGDPSMHEISPFVTLKKSSTVETVQIEAGIES